jgi:hypothetical protein
MGSDFTEAERNKMHFIGVALPGRRVNMGQIGAHGFRIKASEWRDRAAP